MKPHNDRQLWCATLAALLGAATARAQSPEPVAPSPAPAPPAPAPPVPAPAEPAPPPPSPEPSASPLEPPGAPPQPEPPAPPPTDSRPGALEAPPEVTPSTTPAVSVVGVAPVLPPRPVRAERRLALLGELSWNGLAGFGPNLIFHVDPHLSIDLGAGLAFVGWKLGLRTRYNFLTSETTPFIGAGILGATGFDAPSQDIAADDDNRELNIKAKPSAFVQLTAGLDYTDSDGFTFLGSIGYAILVSRDNVEIVTGEPTAEERRAFDVLFRSGLVLSVGLGYAFR